MESLTTVDFYKSILQSVGCIVGNDGTVYINDGTDSPIPLTINKRQLMLPTSEVLRAGLGERIGFAPAGESIVRKESPVMKRLRDLVSTRITYVVSELMESLMGIAADHSKHPLLTPEQSEFLSLVPDADEKTINDLSNVLDRIDVKGDHQLVRIYIKPNGKIGDTVYKRLAAVSFPMMEAAKQEDQKIFGVKLRKADKKAILALFDYLIPNAAVLGHWNAGSNNMMAPGFQSLMLAYGNIIRQLNSMVELFSSILEPRAVPLLSDIDWVESIEEIAKHRAAVNTLPGNDGEVIRDSNTGETPAEETAQPSAPVGKVVGTLKHAPAETKPANEPPPGTIRAFTRPLTEAKGVKVPTPAAPQPTQGFTVVETPVVQPMANQRNWMDIQRQREVGYAVGGTAYQQPTYQQPVYQQPAYQPPPPAAYYNNAYNQPPQQAPYQTPAPVPVGQMIELPPNHGIQVPAHLHGIRVFVDQTGQPFDQMGVPISTQTMHVLGYQLETAPVYSQGYNGYQQSPYAAPATGRAAGTAAAQARLQQERNAYSQYPQQQSPYGYR